MKRLLLTLAALLFAAAPLSAQRAVRVDNPTGALTEPANLWTANAAGIATGLTGSGFGGGATAAGYLGGYRVEQYPPNFAAYSIPFWINDDQWVTWVETSEALGLLGLGSAATRDVGTAEGNLVEIDGFGGITLTGPISAPGGLDAGQSQFSQVITPQLRATGISGLITVPTVSGTLLLADGNGGSLTNLNASSLASGTVPSARLPAATETVVGGLEIATAAEIATGTDNTRAVSPLGLRSYLATATGDIALDTSEAFYSDGATPNRRVEWAMGASGNVAGSALSEVGHVFRVPTSNPASSTLWFHIFSYSEANTVRPDTQSNSLFACIDDAGALRIQIQIAGGGNYRFSRLLNFRSIYSGQMVRLDVIFSVGTNFPTVYLNGVDVTASFAAQSTNGTVPDWMHAGSSSWSTWRMSGWGWPAGEFIPGSSINRVLSAAEIATTIQTNALLPQDRLGGSAVATTAGLFTSGLRYRIVTVGTTDFTAIGASANTVGVEFTATAVGSGTGTAVALGALIQPEITRTAQVLDRANRLRGICTAGIRPLTDRDPQPFEFTLNTTGAFVTQASTNPLFFEPGIITDLYASGVAGADITLRLNSSSSNNLVTPATDIPTTNPTKLTLLDSQRNVAAGDTIWGLASTGTILVRGFWARRSSPGLVGPLFSLSGLIDNNPLYAYKMQWTLSVENSRIYLTLISFTKGTYGQVFDPCFQIDAETPVYFSAGTSIDVTRTTGTLRVGMRHHSAGFPTADPWGPYTKRWAYPAVVEEFLNQVPVNNG